MSPEQTLTTDQLRELDALDAALAGGIVPADLADIESLVRDVRAHAPEMRTGLAGELGERARAGFPRRRRSPARRLGLLAAPGVAAIVAVALVVGGGSGGSTQAGQSSAVQAKAPPAARSVPAPATAGASVGPSYAIPVLPGPGARQIQRGVQLGLSTPADRLQATADRVVQTIAGYGGTVASSNVSSTDRIGGQAYFDLVVPADRTDAAVTALSALGHVQSLTRDTLDITQPIADARHRLETLRAQRDALQRRIAGGGPPSQIAVDRVRLNQITLQIAAAAAALGQLAGRAQSSHVNLTITASGQSGGAAGAWTPGDALGPALSVLEVTADVLLVALALLVAAAALVGLPLLGTRTLRRRRREQALVTGA